MLCWLSFPSAVLMVVVMPVGMKVVVGDYDIAGGTVHGRIQGLSASKINLICNVDDASVTSFESLYFCCC